MGKCKLLKKEQHSFFLFYTKIRQNTSKTARKAKFIAENSFMYPPAFPPCSDECAMYVRNVMRLARDEIIVPQPPMFKPYKSGFHDFAKRESRIALGTFDIA